MTNYASGLSCPTSETLRLTTFPLPASFNMLTSTTLSGYIMAALLQNTVYPYVTFANGSLDWNSSITDWVSHNSNYTVWQFNVKPGLQWSNGQPITAQDILNTYSQNYALNSSYDLVGAGPEVQSERAVNSSTAEFVLNQTDAHFAERISLMIFENVQPASSIAQGPAANLFNQNVTDGPYFIAQPYVSGSSQVVLDRNPNYKPLPSACQLIVNFVESSSQLSEFLTSGSTDVAGPVDPSSVSADLHNPSIHLIDEKGVNIMTLQYNVTSYPYNMTAFRQALAFSVNQSQILKQALSGYAVPAYSAEGGVSPTAGPLYDQSVPQYSFNQTQALSLLQSIGITKGSDGVLQYKNGTAVSLNLITDSDQTFDVVAAGIAQANLQQLGFHVSTQVLSGQTITGDFPGNVNDIQHAMILYTSIGGAFFQNAWTDAQPGYHVYLLSYGVGGNYWEYPPSANDQYNSNLTALDNTSNAAQEKTYIDSIQSLNAKYLPVVTLAYPDEIWAYNTQHWTGWPSRYFYVGSWLNDTALAAVQPVSIGSSTTGSTSTTSSSSALSYGAAALIGVTAAIIIAVAAFGLTTGHRRSDGALPR